MSWKDQVTLHTPFHALIACAVQTNQMLRDLLREIQLVNFVPLIFVSTYCCWPLRMLYSFIFSSFHSARGHTLKFWEIWRSVGGRIDLIISRDWIEELASFCIWCHKRTGKQEAFSCRSYPGHWLSIFSPFLRHLIFLQLLLLLLHLTKLWKWQTRFFYSLILPCLYITLGPWSGSCRTLETG